MPFRKIIFWIHLIAGIAAGLVILLMSFTGVLLSFEKQIVAWADRDLLGGAPPVAAFRLPLSVLTDKGKAAAGGASPTSVTFYSGKRAMAAATNGPTIYVDSYSGNILGTGTVVTRDFFRTVTNWHRYLAMSGDTRATGRTITGAANFIFMFIVLAGILLWIPRGYWNLKTMRGITWFKSGQSSKARNWNWHNVFGFWAAIPLFLIVLSGTVMSYPWASNLVYRLSGSQPPAQNGGGDGRGSGSRETKNGDTRLAQINPLVAVAEAQVSNWKTINLRLPAAANGPVRFTIDEGNGGRPQLRSMLTVNRDTGEVVRLERFRDQDAGRQNRSWLRFAHTGEFYGLAGQTAAGVASFAACMLVWTGFSLSWKRFRTWGKARS